jgi:hypothetical protein
MVPLGSNTLDASGLHADPCAGWIIGECEVIRRLSPGGVKVLLGQRDETLVVLKKLDEDAAAVQDLATHATRLMESAHPHLARVFGCEASDEGLFWVTEFQSGATLHEIRAACRKAGKSLPFGLVFASIHEAALALGELHDRGLAHGDVSAGNLLVTFSGSAVVLNPGVLDCMQQLPPDAPCDVHKLALLLYECLTGQPPALGAFAPPSNFNHAVEPAVDALLKRALGADRSRRFTNGTAFARELKQAAGAFLWKTSARAEFVKGLFRRRLEREQVLLSTAKQRVAARKAREVEDAELPIIVGELIEDSQPVRQRRVLEKAAPSKLRIVPVIGAGALAAMAVAVVALALRAPPPPPPVIVVQVPVAPAPASAQEPAKEAAAVAAEPEAVAEPEPQAEPEEAASEPEQAAETPKAAHHKKHHDEAPLPPWLRRSGRR